MPVMKRRIPSALGKNFISSFAAKVTRMGDAELSVTEGGPCYGLRKNTNVPRLFPTTTSGSLSLLIYPATTCVPMPELSSICCGMKSRSEEHTSELQSQSNLVCRLLLEKKKNRKDNK